MSKKKDLKIHFTVTLDRSYVDAHNVDACLKTFGGELDFVITRAKNAMRDLITRVKTTGRIR